MSFPSRLARAHAANADIVGASSDWISDASIEEAAVTQGCCQQIPPKSNVGVTAEFSDGTKGYRRRCRNVKIEGRGVGAVASREPNASSNEATTVSSRTPTTHSLKKFFEFS